MIYSFDNNKIYKNKLFAILTDMHIETETDIDNFKNIVSSYEEVRPDYILILGDIIHDTEVSKKTLEAIKQLLSRISSIAPTYVILGNHDQMHYHNGWTISRCQELHDILNNTNRTILLENDTVTLPDNITLTGIDLSSSFYELNCEKSSIYVDKIKKATTENLNPNSYNIIMQHTPNNLFEKDVVKNIPFFDNADLALAGHLHNGLVPSYISNIIKGNRGIVGYQGNQLVLFKNFCRGKIAINDHLQGITFAPIKTFSGKLSTLNKLYPSQTQYVLLRKK